MKTVRHSREMLPTLSREAVNRLAELSARPDDEIDTADILELTDEQWAKAVQGKFYRPVKQQITARLDADVLAWLKAQGKGYQARMNAILRREMLSALKARRRA